PAATPAVISGPGRLCVGVGAHGMAAAVAQVAHAAGVRPRLRGGGPSCDGSQPYAAWTWAGRTHAGCVPCVHGSHGFHLAGRLDHLPADLWIRARADHGLRLLSAPTGLGVAFCRAR